MLTEQQRLNMLEPPTGKVALIIDSDTGDEEDDQFAIAYVLEKLNVKALCRYVFHIYRDNLFTDLFRTLAKA